MTPITTVVWFIMGLAGLLTGAYILGGWGAVLLAIGLFVLIGLSHDAILTAIRNRK